MVLSYDFRLRLFYDRNLISISPYFFLSQFFFFKDFTCAFCEVILLLQINCRKPQFPKSSTTWSQMRALLPKEKKRGDRHAPLLPPNPVLASWTSGGLWGVKGDGVITKRCGHSQPVSGGGLKRKQMKGNKTIASLLIPQSFISS